MPSKKDKSQIALSKIIWPLRVMSPSQLHAPANLAYRRTAFWKFAGTILPPRDPGATGRAALLFAYKLSLSFKYLIGPISSVGAES